MSPYFKITSGNKWVNGYYWFHSPPVLGPALPPGFRRAAYENDQDNNGEDESDFLGPALPPGYQADSSSSEDEDMIGPMPSKGPVQESVAQDFERRAKRMKDKLTGKVSPHTPPHLFLYSVHCINSEVK